MKIINEFCLVKDKKIECVLIKSDNKTSLSPLVLLHEGLGSVALWKNFPEVLSKFLQRKRASLKFIGKEKLHGKV